MPQSHTKLIHTVCCFFYLLGLSSLPIGGAESQTKTKSTDSTAIATFAGGSFWCLEPAFEKLPGVLAVLSGYTGGNDTMPTYESVSAGGTGHVEAVQVHFNPKTITYAKLLDVFWKNIDPTRMDGQFSDEGAQFRTVIYFLDEKQRRLATSSKKNMEKSQRFGKQKSIVTDIAPATRFFPAEDNHQDFYKRNPGRYMTYRKFSGRDKFFQKIWGTVAEGKP
jgi:peptide methionine sulfoxide reductase msrA/msrB